MFITFVEQAIGLTILGVEYSVLIAMAIVDPRISFTKKEGSR